ncbi:MAG: type II/IV secretion system protein, partial [Planctomycetes bacterium]|nr:type II/IV secretion system protein [Planctomycetota bacterium]
RSMLRQAPNVILVGEIRDKETAEIAVQAALTGHLVFSTLHTNDAPSAITRLIDIGVKPFLVASAVQAIMAQRLVRCICEQCKEPAEPDPKSMMLLKIKPEDMKGITLYKGRGCPNCSNTGNRGRTGVFELMEMNRELRELAFKQKPVAEIRKQAKMSGMYTLEQDGIRKSFAGTTTLEEVIKNTARDESE